MKTTSTRTGRFPFSRQTGMRLHSECRLTMAIGPIPASQVLGQQEIWTPTYGKRCIVCLNVDTYICYPVVCIVILHALTACTYAEQFLMNVVCFAHVWGQNKHNFASRPQFPREDVSAQKSHVSVHNDRPIASLCPLLSRHPGSLQLMLVVLVLRVH